MLITAPGRGRESSAAAHSHGVLFIGGRADHDRFLRGVCAAGPGLAWLGATTTEIRAACRRTRPDLVVVDWFSTRPLSSCLVARRTLPATTIFLLRCGDEPIGPADWTGLTGVVDGVLACTGGQASMAEMLTVSAETSAALVEAGAGSIPTGLFGLEKVVLRLAADGKTAETTAADLHIEAADVEALLRSAKRKLGARSRAHAVALALRAGLIPR